MVRLASLSSAKPQIRPPVTTDFLCREARLVIEVDGATHSTDIEIAYDGRRTAYLRSQGYRIVRVLNDDIYRHFDDVMDMILLALEGKVPGVQ